MSQKKRKFIRQTNVSDFFSKKPRPKPDNTQPTDDVDEADEKSRKMDGAEDPIQPKSSKMEVDDEPSDQGNYFAVIGLAYSCQKYFS